MLEIAGKTLKSQKTCKAKKKNTLIAGNAGDEKNLRPGGRKFICF